MDFPWVLRVMTVTTEFELTRRESRLLDQVLLTYILTWQLP